MGSRLPVDERRSQLLTLAHTLFADRTYEEISIDEIAKAAGISKGLLYHYFSSKRAFYVAAVEHAAQMLLDATDFDDDGLTELEALNLGLDNYLRFVQERAVAYSFLLRGGMASDNEVRDLVERTRQRFAERFIEDLGLAEPSPRLRVVVAGFVGFVERASLQWLAEGEPERKELVALLADVAVRLMVVAPK